MSISVEEIKSILRKITLENSEYFKLTEAQIKEYAISLQKTSSGRSLDSFEFRRLKLYSFKKEFQKRNIRIGLHKIQWEKPQYIRYHTYQTHYRLYKSSGAWNVLIHSDINGNFLKKENYGTLEKIMLFGMLENEEKDWYITIHVYNNGIIDYIGCERKLDEKSIPVYIKTKIEEIRKEYLREVKNDI